MLWKWERRIPWWEGLYSINIDKKVFSYKRKEKREIKITPSNGKVWLSRNNVQTQYSVFMLYCMAFYQEWRKFIPWFGNKYSIDKQGNVFSHHKLWFIMIYPNKAKRNKYLVVNLKKTWWRYIKIRVNYLVYNTFIWVPKKCVTYNIDGDIYNNCLNNIGIETLVKSRKNLYEIWKE